MVSPTPNEEKVDSIIQVTQTFRSSTDLKDFRNWLLDQWPSKKDEPLSQFSPRKTDKWVGFGDRFHQES